MKIRLDKLLLERGLAGSRERAQALVLAGRVLVDEQKIEKSGTLVPSSAGLRILGEEPRYVSRGGIKLETALLHWKIDLTGRYCADIGASTGGFTDCMLQHGAVGVVALDTGYGQIAENLRRDPRLSLRERTNARHLRPGDLPSCISFVAMDVSFISATLLLSPVFGSILSFAGPVLESVILVKPQFEAGREQVGKGGIVRNPEAHRLAIDRVRNSLLQAGASDSDLIDSPILGAKGNREFLLYGRFAAREV